MFQCFECWAKFKTPRDECPKCGGTDIDLANSTKGRCPDCGKAGETAGHMECQYPQDHS